MNDSITPETHTLRQRIEAAYLMQLKAEGVAPASVFRLCQSLGITEREFFAEYATLQSVELHWWRGMMNGVIHSVENSGEWASFSARQRLLVFMFAFTEASLEHRSLFLLRAAGSPMKSLPQWSGLEERYADFAKSLLALGRGNGEIMSRGPLSLAYPQAMKLLLRSVIVFHLKDESAKFERTDAFIEKSVGLFFDLVGHQALDSGFDLVRFLTSGATRKG